MEREVDGSYVTKVTAVDENGIRRVYAIFSKEVLGKETMLMYEVDSPEDKFYQSDAYGLSARALSRSTLPAYVVSNQRTRSLASTAVKLKREREEIHVYDEPVPDTIRDFCSNNTSTAPRQSCSHNQSSVTSDLHQSPPRLCPHSPPRHFAPLEIIKEEDSIFSVPETLGYLETSWSVRRASTPPPYNIMDNRRRPQVIAHLDYSTLPVYYDYGSALSLRTPLPDSSAEMSISFRDESPARTSAVSRTTTSPTTRFL